MAGFSGNGPELYCGFRELQAENGIVLRVKSAAFAGNTGSLLGKGGF